MPAGTCVWVRAQARKTKSIAAADRLSQLTVCSLIRRHSISSGLSAALLQWSKVATLSMQPSSVAARSCLFISWKCRFPQKYDSASRRRAKQQTRKQKRLDYMWLAKSLTLIQNKRDHACSLSLTFALQDFCYFVCAFGMFGPIDIRVKHPTNLSIVNFPNNRDRDGERTDWATRPALGHMIG